MNRKIYRICLIAAIVIAVFGGVVYYQFYQRQELSPRDGSFVRNGFVSEADILFAGAEEHDGRSSV